MQAVSERRASVRLDCGTVCDRLFENHRGGDAFVDFKEAVALDVRAAQLAGSECSWPPPLRLSSESCWHDVSMGGQRELTADHACRFVKCRAKLGSVACLPSLCP